jgi:hypothetical protein
VARHVCQECGATVSGDEQFCPTCGSFLGPDEVVEPTEDFEEFDLGAPPPPQAGARSQGGMITCPSCGASNHPGNRHCEECGARLSQGPLPAAPRPAVQATAGVRAVVAIASLLLGVILIALLFRIFGGGDDTPSDTTSAAGSSTSTTAERVEPAPLDPLSVECSVEALGSFVCNNLISGPETLYQVVWPEVEQSGEELTITIRFRTAVAITRIDWRNITDDETRFRRNYRARSLSVSADDVNSAVQFELQNIPGVQELTFTSLQTNQVTITVDSVWQPDLVEGEVFTELVIDEIQVIGYPATGGVTDTTGATDTTGGGTDTTGGGDTTSPTTAPTDTTGG